VPFSVRENNADVINVVVEHDLLTVLDIGPGAGTYSDLLKPLLTRIDCIEIWEPYVAKFQLMRKYDTVVIADVRHMSASSAWDGKYDLVILGDVLEHMTRLEAIGVWAWASCVARWGIISVPIGHWPQGPHEGNPHEEHVQEDLDVESVERYFGPFTYTRVYEQTATFIKEFT
jgi:predicted TPR repeat methyltransferase